MYSRRGIQDVKTVIKQTQHPKNSPANIISLYEDIYRVITILHQPFSLNTQALDN